MTFRLGLTAAICAILSALLIGYWLYGVSQTAVTQKFLSVKRQIVRGGLITDEMIATVDLPAWEQVKKIAIEDSQTNRDWVKGRRAVQDIEAGSLMLFQQFSDDPMMGLAARIDPAKRAVSIPATPQNAVSLLVEPGSLIDVIVVFEEPPQQSADAAARRVRDNEPVARTLLRGVRVLAVGTSLARSPFINLAERGYTTVTVEVTPEEASRIALALTQTRSGFVLALRNPQAADPGQAPPQEMRLGTTTR